MFRTIKLIFEPMTSKIVLLAQNYPYRALGARRIPNTIVKEVGDLGRLGADDGDDDDEGMRVEKKD